MAKKRLRSITWDDYGISKYRYNELKAFCLQYTEKKRKISRGIRTAIIDGMPHAAAKGDALEKQAIRNVQLQRDCEMIEQAALKASAEYYPQIIYSVTNDCPFWQLQTCGRYESMTITKTDFYGIRRLFYHYLDEMKSQS